MKSYSDLTFKLDHDKLSWLVYQYPVLRQFILRCWENQDDDKLLDFLFSIETYDCHTGGH